jgi:Myristoyl-CoA:protein N-myristoyltransferase, N-terminal domain
MSWSFHQTTHFLSHELFQFWATQPVVQYGTCFKVFYEFKIPSFVGEKITSEDGYIEASKPREEVRQEPYPLPKEFEWSQIDIDDSTQVSFFCNRLTYLTVVFS